MHANNEQDTQKSEETTTTTRIAELQGIELAPTQEEEIQIEKNLQIAAPQQHANNSKLWYLALVAGVTTHVLSGLHPVFSRYLQFFIPIPFPPLLLLASMNALTLILLSPRVAYLCVFKVVELKGRATRQQVKHVVVRDLLKNWLFWAFLFTFVLRSITNIMASKYATGIYVQLVALAIPFMSTFLAYVISQVHRRIFKPVQVLFADETVNWKTLFALIVTCIGSILIILGGVGKSEHWYDFATRFNFFTLETMRFSVWDGLGMFLSFVSSLAFAMYMLLLRYAKSNKREATELQLLDLNNGGT